MADKELQHSLNFDGSALTVRGVRQVSEIDDKQAVFKLDKNVLTVRGGGLNVVKLDKEQGVVVIEAGSISSIGYRQSGISIKGLFR